MWDPNWEINNQPEPRESSPSVESARRFLASCRRRPPKPEPTPEPVPEPKPKPEPRKRDYQKIKKNQQKHAVKKKLKKAEFPEEHTEEALERFAAGRSWKTFVRSKGFSVAYH